MQLQQLIDGLDTAPAPAAVGGGAETVDVLSGGLDAGASALDAVVEAHEPEVELGLLVEEERGQGRKPGGAGRASHRHVYPVQRSVEVGGQRVGHLDQAPAITGLSEVAVGLVAVAEVKAELDVARDGPAQSQQALEHTGAHLVKPGHRDPLQHGELKPRIPLDGQLLGGDRRHDARDLLEYPRLVDGLERRLIVGCDKGADRGQWGGQGELEAHVTGDQAVALEASKGAVRGNCRLGVAEGPEGHGVGPDTGLEAQLGQGAVAVVARRADLELGGELNTGYCQRIQSERGPVSPSGMRRSRSPRAPAVRWKTSSALPRGTLPTRCTPTGSPEATARRRHRRESAGCTRRPGVRTRRR